MIATDYISLGKAASAYQAITGDAAAQVQVYLLAQIAGAPYATMTAQQLIAAANGFQIMDGLTAKQVQAFLLATITNTV